MPDANTSGSRALFAINRLVYCYVYRGKWVGVLMMGKEGHVPSANVIDAKERTAHLPTFAGFAAAAFRKSRMLNDGRGNGYVKINKQTHLKCFHLLL